MSISGPCLTPPHHARAFHTSRAWACYTAPAPRRDCSSAFSALAYTETSSSSLNLEHKANSSTGNRPIPLPKIVPLRCQRQFGRSLGCTWDIQGGFTSADSQDRKLPRLLDIATWQFGPRVPCLYNAGRSCSGKADTHCRVRETLAGRGCAVLNKLSPRGCSYP